MESPCAQADEACSLLLKQSRREQQVVERCLNAYTLQAGEHSEAESCHLHLATCRRPTRLVNQQGANPTLLRSTLRDTVRALTVLRDQTQTQPSTARCHVQPLAVPH